jgi:transglutaminase-like putative cysteine protease
MSSLAAPGRTRAEPGAWRPAARRQAQRARPAVRLITFAALGLYGSVRWATLVAPAATGAMLVLLAFALAAAGLLGWQAELGGRPRLLAIPGVLLLLVAMLPVCGVPLSLVVHAHLRAIDDGLHLGLVALPRTIVPYAGVDPWARTVILLGGGLLLLDAAVLLAFVPASLGDARRAGAALPLIALAIVPSVLEAQHAVYLQGLLLFVLVAAFVWGERLGRRELVPALAIAVVAGAAGWLAAPSLNIHRPLLNYQSIANTFTPGGIETFQWYQGYGPYTWPTAGKQVLEVRARHPEFWKTENLDDFDGRGWVLAQDEPGSNLTTPPVLPAPSPPVAAAFTQTLRVTLGTMYSSDVIVAGMAQKPTAVPDGVVPGASPGTWVANHQLGPGDAYLVRVYAPNPTAAQLAAAGDSYPADSSFYRLILLPTSGTAPAGTISFPPFGTPKSSPSAAYVASTLEASVYAPAYRLAQRLEAGATTPYAFVMRVEDYLLRNYSYNTDAPISSLPLLTFLFERKYGYCQQFAGAMALLLRMGGVPARVAVGFTPGTYSSSAGAFEVDDTSAHSWVEAWFPGYGWVAFNPTPGTGLTPLKGALAGGGSTRALSRASQRNHLGATPAATATSRHGAGTASAILIAAIVVIVLLALGAGVALLARARGGPPDSSDDLLAELERALRRSDIHLAPSTTLAQLERRFKRSPEAVEYVRSVSRARFAGVAVAPTRGQRRAFRAQLAVGRGAFGRLRAVWALPPRRSAPNNMGRHGG